MNKLSKPTKLNTGIKKANKASENSKVKVNIEVLREITETLNAAYFLGCTVEEAAKHLTVLIINGRIPHLKIQYHLWQQGGANEPNGSRVLSRVVCDHADHRGRKGTVRGSRE